jgi:hypothetical protein
VRAVAIPSVRHVRRWLRAARRAHSDRTLGELLGDVYMFALLGALYGGSSVVSIRRHLAQPLGAPVAQTARAWLVAALVVTAVVVAWRGLRMLGPLVTTPAAQAWCVASPIDRADWLRVPLWWLLVVTACVGAGVAVLAAWAGLSTGTEYGWAAAAGVGLGSALGALAVVAQSRPAPRRDVARSQAVAVVGSLLLVAATVVLARSGADLPPLGVPGPLVAAAGCAAAGWSVMRAGRSLSTVDRITLAPGAQIVGAAMSALIMIDPAYVSAVLAARRWRGVGKVRGRPWRPGRRAWVLLQADLRRQGRRRSDVFTWAALMVAPYAVAAFAPGAVASARIIAAYLAAERLAAGLRTVCRSPMLRRSLGGTDRTLRWIHLVVPAAGLAIWWVGTLRAGAVHPTAVTVALALGVLLAVYRTATRKPPSYDGGLAATPFGPVPINLVRQAVRGPDLVAILVLIGLIVPVAGGPAALSV